MAKNTARSPKPTEQEQPSKVRGGRRPGAGRPPIEGVSLDASVLVRMTAQQKACFLRLGGSRWIRTIINEHTRSDEQRIPGYEGEPRHSEPLVLPLAENTVQAGFPSPAENYERNDIDLNKLLVKNKAATFLLRVQGDSMVDAGISEGDLLVVDRCIFPRKGDIVVMQVNNDFTVKRYCLTSKGVPYLHAENKTGAYPDIYPSDSDEWLCFGVVRYALKAL